MPTDIGSFPVELVCRIIKSAVHFCGPGNVHCRIAPPAPHILSVINSSNRRLLRMTSLVCQKWSVESRKLLWGHIDISRDETARKIINSSGFGVYCTKSLKLRGPWEKEDGVTPHSVQTMLDGLRGMRHLELWYFDETAGLSAEFLFAPTLHSESISVINLQ